VRRLPSSLPSSGADDLRSRAPGNYRQFTSDDYYGGPVVDPSYNRSAPHNTQQPSPAPFDLRPLPDIGTPAERGSTLDDNRAPPLLNGTRDHTAIFRPIPTRWAARRIDWPERQVSHQIDDHSSERVSAGSTKPGSARRLDTHRARWDSTGWRSGR
jgi:hypothetical protein